MSSTEQDNEYKLATFYKDQPQHKLFKNLDDQVKQQLHTLSKTYETPTQDQEARGSGWKRPWPEAWSMDQKEAKGILNKVKKKFDSSEQSVAREQDSNEPATPGGSLLASFDPPDARSTPSRQSKEAADHLFTPNQASEQATKDGKQEPSIFERLVPWRNKATPPNNALRGADSFVSANSTPQSDATQVFSGIPDITTETDETTLMSLPQSKADAANAQQDPTVVSTEDFTAPKHVLEELSRQNLSSDSQYPSTPTPTPSSKATIIRTRLVAPGSGTQAQSESPKTTQLTQLHDIKEFLESTINSTSEISELKGLLQKKIESCSTEHRNLLQYLPEILFGSGRNGAVARINAKKKLQSINGRLKSEENIELVMSKFCRDNYAKSGAEQVQPVQPVQQTQITQPVQQQTQPVQQQTQPVQQQTQPVQQQTHPVQQQTQPVRQQTQPIQQQTQPVQQQTQPVRQQTQPVQQQTQPVQQQTQPIQQQTQPVQQQTQPIQQSQRVPLSRFARFMHPNYKHFPELVEARPPQRVPEFDPNNSNIREVSDSDLVRNYLVKNPLRPTNFSAYSPIGKGFWLKIEDPDLHDRMVFAYAHGLTRKNQLLVEAEGIDGRDYSRCWILPVSAYMDDIRAYRHFRGQGQSTEIPYGEPKDLVNMTSQDIYVNNVARYPQKSANRFADCCVQIITKATGEEHFSWKWYTYSDIKKCVGGAACQLIDLLMEKPSKTPSISQLISGMGNLNVDQPTQPRAQPQLRAQPQFQPPLFNVTTDQNSHPQTHSSTSGNGYTTHYGQSNMYTIPAQFQNLPQGYQIDQSFPGVRQPPLPYTTAHLQNVQPQPFQTGYPLNPSTLQSHGPPPAMPIVSTMPIQSMYNQYPIYTQSADGGFQQTHQGHGTTHSLWPNGQQGAPNLPPFRP